MPHHRHHKTNASLASLLAALAATAGAAGCGRDAEKAAVAPTPAAERAGPTAPRPHAAAVPEARAASLLPGMTCLVNEHGIRAKVLVTRPNVRCVDSVPAGVPAGASLRQFWPYFVFETWPKSAAADGRPPQFYRIGSTPRPDSILGWVPAASAVAWDTRVGARYRRREDGRTPPLLVYAEKAPLLEILRTGTTRAEPLARASLAADAGRALMPWPIIDVDRVEQGGRTYELVKLAFLGQYRSGASLVAAAQEVPASESAPAQPPAPQYSAAEFDTLQGSARQLDVVFVLDTTASMQPVIDAAAATIADLAGRLRRIDAGADVAFGLVAFRDHDAASGYVTRDFGFERSPDRFLQSLRSLTAAEGGGTAEAVYDGVDAALRFPWRSRLSRRIVVLVGDAPAHEPGDPENPRRLSIDGLAATAKERQATIMALPVDSGVEGPSRDLRTRQFGRLADRTGGACRPIAQASTVEAEVRRILASERERATLNANVLADVRDGKDVGRIAAERDVDAARVTEVMEFLSTRGVDLGRLRAGGGDGPTFSSGWALCEVRDTPVLDREVFLAQAELDVLLASLNLLCTSLRSDFAQAVSAVSLGGRVEPLAQFFQGDGPEPLDVFLMSQGVPLGRSALLRLTPAEIRHMPEERRAALRDRIARRVVPMLTNCRTDSSLWTRCDDLEFGWVPEEVLP